MSREKSDLAKLLDGRCQGRGEGYSSWIHANEVGSDGSAFVIPDPVAKREVHVLSNAERIVFWQLRFDPEVYEIREQMLLYPKFIDEICEKHHYRKPQRMLTTDFFVEYHDHRLEAISVKTDRSVYATPAYCTQREKRRIIRRQELREMQKEYWQDYFDVPFFEIFSDELDHFYSNNIERCMTYYDLALVDDVEEHLFCYMVANRLINVDLTGRYVSFKELLTSHREEMRSLIYAGGECYA